MTIYEKLSAIQIELKVPKDQENTFGNYKYRSCEDILEKVKPLCKEQKTVLVLLDELVNIGGRYYVKATAQLHDIESDTWIFSVGYAREEETKKGMDGSQITGASSSYARKYALNGLFCIDDVKDSDFTNTGEQKPQQKPHETRQAAAPVQKATQIWKCEDCGAEIADNVHGYSLLHYGNHSYCVKCQKNHAVVRR